MAKGGLEQSVVSPGAFAVAVEKVEKKFSKDKKRKKYSSGRRNRNSFEKDKSMGNFRSKRKNKKKNKRY